MKTGTLASIAPGEQKYQHSRGRTVNPSFHDVGQRYCPGFRARKTLADIESVMFSAIVCHVRAGNRGIQQIDVAIVGNLRVQRAARQKGVRVLAAANWA